MQNFSFCYPKVAKLSSTIRGNPAWETHSIAGKTFKTWVLVNDRFMVQVSIENGSQADYDSFINAINFAGIK